MTPLDHAWTLSFTHPITGAQCRIPATVPGNVELDLLREGLITDPYPPDNLHTMRAWELVDDWTYETSFDAPERQPDERLQLVFEGIDTIADIMLNGCHILHCENMFIPHRADVTDLLHPRGNTLAVCIRSALVHTRRFDYPAGQISRAHRQGEAYLRKARHMWGWDNAPRLLSAGLWRPVYLQPVPPIRFIDVYTYTHQVTPEAVIFGARWWIATPDTDLRSYRGLLQLSDHARVVHEQPFDVECVAGRITCTLPAGAVKLWWPRGYGDPHVYHLTLSLFKNDTLAAEWRGRMGLRDLRFIYTETTDAAGHGECCFFCNGERVYIRGTNWKPLDALHSRAAARTHDALQLCLDLNCNMVRVWGGGIYEDHPFFDFCDEHGLLVWQDFMFACEFPPRDETFQRAVFDEACCIVKRLRNHPSLAVWCGDNEVDDTFLWGGLIPSHLLPSDNVISRRVLKEAVITHDPYRAYVPSSPFVSDQIVRRQWLPSPELPDLATPEKHLYPRDEHYRDAYRTCPAHFIGETGPFFFCPMSASPGIVARDLPRAQRLWGTPFPRARYVLDRHQDDTDFLTWQDAARHRLNWFFARHFDLEHPDELALALNIICADVYKFAIEWSRAHKWRKTGVLWWSLLDMWPMMFNYSIVDYNLRKKQPCYDWIKRSQQPLCLLIADRGAGDLALIAANDTLDATDGTYCISTVDARGHAAHLCSGTFAAPANASSRVHTIERPSAQMLWLTEWQTSRWRGSNHFVTGTPPYDFEVYRRWVAATSTTEVHS